MNSGVRPERMSAIGYGEYQPIADNRSEQGRLQNRRVVLVIMGNVDNPLPDI
jgi:chemotaxis protein MotB